MTTQDIWLWIYWPCDFSILYSKIDLNLHSPHQQKTDTQHNHLVRFFVFCQNGMRWNGVILLELLNSTVIAGNHFRICYSMGSKTIFLYLGSLGCPFYGHGYGLSNEILIYEIWCMAHRTSLRHVTLNNIPRKTQLILFSTE